LKTLEIFPTDDFIEKVALLISLKKFEKNSTTDLIEKKLKNISNVDFIEKKLKKIFTADFIEKI
jgi:hypothetical protein